MDIAASATGQVDVNIVYAVPILGTITFGGIIDFEVTIRVGAFNCGIHRYGLGLDALQDKDKHYAITNEGSSPSVVVGADQLEVATPTVEVTLMSGSLPFGHDAQSLVTMLISQLVAQPTIKQLVADAITGQASTPRARSPSHSHTARLRPDTPASASQPFHPS